MSQSELLQNLQYEIQHAPCDIRAESVLLLAMEKGMRKDHFMVHCSKLFRREYSKDAVASELKEEEGKQPQLQVFLSRGGIYDQLPEGLFFQSVQQNRKTSAAELSIDYKRNKKTEAAVRKFFLPFENDFFLQRISIEEEETQLLEGLQSGILNDYFIKFWDLPASIPRHMLAPLLLLLPYASTIAGDLELTAQSLQHILKEPVTVRQKRSGLEDASGIMPPVLGEGTLGLDLVCGNSFWEDTPVFEIEIGPLKKSQIVEYIGNGNRYKVLEAFNRFFIPAGADMKVTIQVPAERRHMVITRGSEPVLGYSSYL